MKVVAMKERSEGNESVGNEWIDTAIFDSRTPLCEVLKWAGALTGDMDPARAGKHGRLMLSVPDELIEKGGEK